MQFLHQTYGLHASVRLVRISSSTVNCSNRKRFHSIIQYFSHWKVVVVVVEIFVHGAVKATVTNARQSQLNKWVFSSFLNWPTVVSDWRSETGRLFQSLGPATWKARSPKPVWVRGTTQVETSDERNRRRPTSETSWQSSDK